MTPARLAKIIERAAETYVNAMMLLVFGLLVTFAAAGLLALIAFGLYSAVSAL